MMDQSVYDNLARINRNIETMGKGGAGKPEIEAYIADEGVTVDDLKAQAGDAWAKERPFARKVATFMKGTLGVGEYVDEAVGFLGEKLIGNQSAENAAELVRSLTAHEERENPKTAIALNIAGGLTSAAPLMMLGGGTAAASRLPSIIPKSVPGKILVGGPVVGGGGTIEGVISGYGSGTTPEERIENAKSRGTSSGLAGLAVGFGVPALTAVAKHGAKMVVDAIRSRAAKKATGLDKTAAKILAPAMEADQAFKGAGASNIARAGPDAMWVDAGPQSRALLDTAVQRGGQAGNIAREAVENRATRANQTVTDTLDKTFGSPTGVGTGEKAIRQNTAAARDTAYARPIDYDAISERVALRNGYDLLRSGTRREDVADLAENMTGAERTQALQGIRSYLDDQLANVQRTVSDGNVDAREAMKAVKDLSSRASRDKVSMVVGEDAAKELFKGLDEAIAALDLRTGVADNSRAFARASMDQEIKSLLEEGVVNAFREGKQVEVTKRISQAIMGRTPANKRSAANEVYEQIARALTSSPRGPAGRSLQALDGTSRRTAQDHRIVDLLVSRAMLALGLPAYQQGTQNLD